MTHDDAIRVLLADDVDDLRRLVRLVLERAGDFTVVGEAATGVEAIDHARDLQPDLIMLDLAMPDLDGLEALPTLLAVAPDTVVVVLSGLDAHRMADQARARGAAGYIVKGTPPEAMLAELRSILGRPGEPAPTAAGASGSPLATPEVLNLSDTELLAVVGHEILSPLATVIGFGETLDRSWDAIPESERREFVGRILRNARDVATTAEQLLHLRQAEDGRIRARPVATPAARFLRDRAERHKLLSGDHVYHEDVADDLPAVHADRSLLGRVLDNVIENAARYAPAGSTITLRGRADGSGGAVIAVEDEGPGIPVEHRDAVFAMFTRLTSGGKGVGLGLFLCRAYVRAMHGDIWIEDRTGGGTAVWLRLPGAPEAPAIEPASS